MERITPRSAISEGLLSVQDVSRHLGYCEKRGFVKIVNKFLDLDSFLLSSYPVPEGEVSPVVVLLTPLSGGESY